MLLSDLLEDWEYKLQEDLDHTVLSDKSRHYPDNIVQALSESF